jgi:hypothetical protein
MQLANVGENFRKELDQRAISKGCTRTPGLAYGSLVSQSYVFHSKSIGYLLEDEHLTLRVTPQPPQTALIAAAQYAINPNRSVASYESDMYEEVKLDWNMEFSAWILHKGSDGSLLGIDDTSFFDDENLAQCCVNWLCN